jgi:CHAT domain-containing protein
MSDPSEPSRSCLLLEDWKDNPLTVGDLRDHRLQENSPFLGYLSACSTGTNKEDRLIDEGIHLVSACQLAGFRHVVGTLWEVSDKHCVDVAKILYETIRDEGVTDVALCRGLHRAVRALRDERIEIGRVTGESGITAVHHNGTEAADVDDNRIDIMQDSNWLKVVSEADLQDTTKAEGGAPATATQTDGRLTCKKEVGDRSCRMAVGGNEDIRTREERDATVVDDENNEIGQESHEIGQLHPRYWAPYIHFGV